MTINNLELVTLLAQAQLFAPKMSPLVHISTAVDNMAAQGWANRGSVSSETAVGPILRDLNLLICNHKIYSSVQCISGVDNKMSESASKLTQLTDKMFLRHFAFNFPQRKPWRLLALMSGCKRRLTSMLHRKRFSMDSLLNSTRNTPPPGEYVE